MTPTIKPFVFDREVLTAQLTTMFKLQDGINTVVHPQWRQQNFAWHRAFWVEMGECADHWGYKWWKNKTPNLAQVQLEIVDAFHFGISALIVKCDSVQRAVEVMLGWLDAYQHTREFADTDFLTANDALVARVLETKSLPPREFTTVLHLAGMDYNELFRQYVGKNVLNHFRQENGYKEGTYKKVWGDREDNEHLTEIMDNLDAASPTFADDVRAGLAERYPRAA